MMIVESFFILSKENLQLAIDEVISISKSYDRHAKFRITSNVVLIRSKIGWETIAKRATYVRRTGMVVKKFSDLFFGEENFLPLFKNYKTFACKVINLSSKKLDIPNLQQMMGGMISAFSQARVSIGNPEIIIYLVLLNDSSFFGISTRFVKSRRPKKVITHPHELDWKLCRAMVNLAGLKENQTICDPFCGTGTTLLEAESMGINSIGIDFDKKMYRMSKQNAAANGYSPKIINSEYNHLTKIQDKYDGIVTDTPYGLASKSTDIPEKLFQNFVSIIPKRKKFVIMCKKGFEKRLKLKPTKKYEIYRHKSLTRMILVK